MRQRALSSLISSSMPLAARLWGSGSHPIGGARGVSLAGMAPTTRMLRASTGDLLVYRLTYNDDVAAGQLAVFQGASDEHI